MYMSALLKVIHSQQQQVLEGEVYKFSQSISMQQKINNNNYYYHIVKWNSKI